MIGSGTRAAAMRVGVVVALAAAVTGCEAIGRLKDQVVLGMRGCGRGGEQLEEVDWEMAQAVDIRIRQDEFYPIVVGLMRDRPYVLVISNGDDEQHGFRSPEFFRHTAIERIAVDGDEIADACIAGVTLPPKSTAEIRLVALLDGTYPFEDPDELFDLEYEYYEDGDGFGTIFVE